jgi:hypothetical protein
MITNWMGTSAMNASSLGMNKYTATSRVTGTTSWPSGSTTLLLSAVDRIYLPSDILPSAQPIEAHEKYLHSSANAANHTQGSDRDQSDERRQYHFTSTKKYVVDSKEMCPHALY